MSAIVYLRGIWLSHGLWSRLFIELYACLLRALRLCVCIYVCVFLLLIHSLCILLLVHEYGRFFGTIYFHTHTHVQVVYFDFICNKYFFFFSKLFWLIYLWLRDDLFMNVCIAVAARLFVFNCNPFCSRWISPHFRLSYLLFVCACVCLFVSFWLNVFINL